jgi:hypothetical protein
MIWAIERITKTRMYRTAALFLSAAVLASPATWAADYEKNYSQGIQAVDHKDWATGAEKMRKAASERPEDGVPIRIYAEFFEPYLPSYYLGLALFRTGDCEGAVKAWQESENRKAVQGMGTLYQRLRQDLDTCKKRLDAEREAKVELDKTMEAQEQVKSRRSDPSFGEAWTHQEGAQEQETQATNLLNQARALLNKGHAPKQIAGLQPKQIADLLSKQIADLQEAGRLAKSSGQSFEKLARQLDDRRRDGIQETAKTVSADPAAPAASPFPRSTGSAPTPLPPRPRTDEALTKQPTRPPDALLDAVRAFQLGDYKKVVRTLDATNATSFAKPRAIAARHLLLAAAFYAQYITGGEKDATLRRRTLKQIHLYRKINPRIPSGNRQFSPRFIDFFTTAK